MLFTIAVGFMLKNLQKMNILLPVVVIILLSSGLLFFDHTITAIGLQLIVGLIVGSVLGLLWRSGKRPLLISWALLAVFIAVPTILWPQSISNNTLLATAFLISIIIGAYSFFSSSPNHAATYRIFIYNCWLIFLIYFALGFNAGFWVTAIAMAIGAGIIFAGANGIEDRQTQHLWWTSQAARWQSRWAIMSTTTPKEKSRRKFIRNLSQITGLKDVGDSIIDTNLWLASRSLQLHQEIEDLLNSFDRNFLIKNPQAVQVAQEAFLDLPTSITL